jgi:micrococcal nuclease
MRPVTAPVSGATGLLLSSLLAACAADDGRGAATGTEPGLPLPASAQQATVVRLVDGDTVLLRGRGVGPLPAQPTRVRLLLVDAPEVHSGAECFGPEATERAASLLPEGATVRVQADRDRNDRYGRTLLHVWNRDGVNVGQALVREGYAEVLVVPPNDRYREGFERAEDEARRAERGLWGACR